MKLRGFLFVIVMAAGLLYLLWLLRVGKEQVPDQGGKEKLPVQIKVYREAELQMTKANMLTLRTAIFMFTAEQGRTPEDLKELKNFGGLRGADLDAWGTSIKYERLSGEHFRLSSAGKDKVFNTADDIVEEY